MEDLNTKNNQNLTQRAVHGFFWKFLENVGMQGIQAIVHIVLARMLLPEDYGIVGLLAIFIAISNVFIQQGLTTALIQKKDADEIDFSSVFFGNIVISIVLYAVLFFCAPAIATFYHQPLLIPITRVLALEIIIGAMSAVHNAILSRNLDFKKSFVRNMSNIVTQGVVGITLALYNWGAWSLVYSRLSGILVGSVVLIITVKWYPKKLFSWIRLKSLFDFGSKVLGTNLLNTLFNNIHSLVIGRFFTTADLGFYQRGQQIPQLSMTAVDGSLNAVMYPTFSIIQNDIPRLKNTLRRSMKTSMYIVLPVLFGLIATAEPLTVVLLTEKWLPSVPFLRLSCVICMFWPLSARTHALNAIGKSGVTFTVSLISKAMTLIFIAICIPFGIYAIMLGTICTSAICMFITSHYVKKYLNYSNIELLKDLFPSLILAAFMCIAIYAFGLLDINIYLKLILQIIIGITFYLSISVLTKNDNLNYLLNIVKSWRQKKS